MTTQFEEDKYKQIEALRAVKAQEREGVRKYASGLMKEIDIMMDGYLAMAKNSEIADIYDKVSSLNDQYYALRWMKMNEEQCDHTKTKN